MDKKAPKKSTKKKHQKITQKPPKSKWQYILFT